MRRTIITHSISPMDIPCVFLVKSTFIEGCSVDRIEGETRPNIKRGWKQVNKKYSKLSVLLSVICAITIFTSYAIAPKQPEGIMVVFIQVLFFTSIITGLLSLIFSFLGFRKKEQGFLKMIAPIVVILILLAFVISFVLMVLSFIWNRVRKCY